jgi:hypothetical protein
MVVYLNISHTIVPLEPGCDQRAVFVCPVVVELVFRELRITSCANCDTYELIGGHGRMIMRLYGIGRDRVF